MIKIRGWIISKFSHFAGKKLLPGILVIFLTVLTISTGIIGMGKVIGSLSYDKVRQTETLQEEVKGVSVSTEEKDTIADNQIVQNGSSNMAGSNNSSAGILRNNSPTQTPTNAASQIPTSGSTSSGSCIITLFGKQYNITSLLTSHSGGNVFACGTDMSASYQSRHGTNVSRMQAYLIGGSSNSASLPTATPTPTSTPAGNNNSGSSTPTPTPNSGGGSCVITLFGQQYNITSLLTSHSGGNVFACGTDMSASYQSRHGTNVSRMQAYLISSGTTPTATPLPTPTPTRAPTPTPTRVPTPTPTRILTPTPTPTRAPSGAPTPTPTRVPTATPTLAPTPTPTRAPTSTPVPTPTPASGCIVILFGKRYEITTLLTSHSGGNVFACGTDMSASYQSRHGTNVTRMQRYLIP